MTDHYRRSVQHHLERVERHNGAELLASAEAVLECVRADGLIHTAGAGHSLAAVAETFYRAGGLACVRPLYLPVLLPLQGAQESTRSERRSGLAAELLGAADCGERDLLVVFSNSGINPYPVELAALATHRGLPVIAVTSSVASTTAPRRAGSTLAAEASIVLDTLVPAGDATYPSATPVTAALSTIAAAFLWNLLLATVSDAAAARGVDVPLWRSANVSGGDEANAELLDRYTARVPELR